MQYDFHSIPDRSHDGSTKWLAVPGASTENVPLSTADMEFPTPPPIADALAEMAQSTILGYTTATPAYYQAVCGWMEHKHHYHVEPEEIIMTPGVVYALGMLVDALSDPGDSVIIISPVYYPFDLSVVAKGRNILYTTLTIDHDRYSINYEELETLAFREDAKLLLFCNPHNPVGRVWSREEMERVVDICARNRVFIIDDEIHHDLIMPGYRHTVMATLSDTARSICAVCTAPSKTFNLAGLQCSNIIIHDKAMWSKAMAVHTLNLLSTLTPFAYRACEVAYTRCDGWLEELIQTVAGNAAYVKEIMVQCAPEVRVIPLEGTYLLWLDMRGLRMTHRELEAFMKEEAGLWLDEGYIFGDSGRGFERINLACSRITLERAMARFTKALDTCRARWTADGRPYHKTLAVGDVLENLVYDTSSGRGVKLAESVLKPTILVFSRYFTCPICQMMLSQIKALWPQIQAAGLDVKVVLQSTLESVAAATADAPFPFDLICDPHAELYDRYNVFEAGSTLAMVGGDAKTIAAMGGVRQMVSSMFAPEKSEGRALQLPAFFLITPDMVVRYAYYSKTMQDIPDLQGLLASMA